MKSFFRKCRQFYQIHKKTSIAIVLIIIVGAIVALRSSSASAETSYVLGTVSKGTIVSSIDGSGQVAATTQIDLKARGSGEITYVGVKGGQSVRKGQSLFALDAREASRAVRDAQTALETAQLDLDKFKQAPDSVDVQLLNGDITRQEKNKTDADKDIETAYRNLLNSSTIASPQGSSSSFTAPTISGTYQNDAEGTITITVRQGGSDPYFTATSDAGIAAGNGIVSTSVAQPIGSTGLYIKFATTDVNQPVWIITLPNKSAASYASNLRAYNDAIEAKTQIVSDADLAIAQDTQKISDLYTPDALDLRAKELAVQQREDSLADARLNLSDYYVYAPFDGIISSVAAKVGDTASGALGTIITTQKLASISLNEVDIAKISLGQKATLTFDALPDLTISGEVVEIDTLGTVTQGVVNYTVKIAFDTDEDSVKPGMSVSASIITAMKTDVLIVPASAVKTGTQGNYVEAFKVAPTTPAASGQGVVSETKPEQLAVETGISDDTSVEVVSGLAEGDQIVTKTTQASTTTKTAAKTTSTSLLGGGSTRAAGTATFGSGAGGFR